VLFDGERGGMDTKISTAKLDVFAWSDITFGWGSVERR
jgi:hypothetical protein